ncbi:MAG TPA: PIG-L family deacetylase, partial [Thermoanaerobaculia bacterium]|nr:PIG-L family deacetylase [Thermoanaerobaculia bacterium]
MITLNDVPGSRILWVGAHPDDELFLAPLLGALSEERTIGFVVATRGQRGPCYRPEGCEPDLATVREEEMRNAAALFGGTVEFADCPDLSAPDDPEGVLRNWNIDRIREAIDRFNPDLIFTFDPHHGGRDHADHRAAGLVIERLRPSVPVWRNATRVHWGEQPPAFSATRPDAIGFDAGDDWHYLIGDLKCHRSQMRPETLDWFANVPVDARTVWVLR